MTTENKLLRQFIDDRSDAAFAEIVRNQLNFVYSICRRKLGNNEQAEDATQAVFLLLAVKAPSVRVESTLSSWLFRTSIFVCKSAVRTETRRRHYERKAAEQMLTNYQTPEPAWGSVEPLIDDAIASLGSRDRDVIILRYIEGLPLQEVGAAFGLTQAAAHKRVARALDRVRRHLARNGVTISGTALTVFLTERMVDAAPAALAVKAIGSLSGAHIATLAVFGAQSHSIYQGALTAMKVLQWKTAITVTGLIIVAGTTISVKLIPAQILRNAELAAAKAPSKDELIVYPFGAVGSSHMLGINYIVKGQCQFNLADSSGQFSQGGSVTPMGLRLPPILRNAWSANGPDLEVWVDRKMETHHGYGAYVLHGPDGKPRATIVISP